MNNINNGKNKKGMVKMFIMNEELQEGDVIKNITIDTPNFPIDDVKKIKALLRFKAKFENLGENSKDMIFKFGRCFKIRTIHGALYQLFIRKSTAGKDKVFVFEPRYYNADNIVCKLITQYEVE